MSRRERRPKPCLWTDASRSVSRLKDRPCAVILHPTNTNGDNVVTVLPITHTPPHKSIADLAIEIPAQTKRRLGFDDERSWIMLTEANRFIWPGPDLRMGTSGDPLSIVYGLLPEKLYDLIRQTFLSALKHRHSQVVQRTE